MPPTLDATFAALADPTRRAILARLTLGDASVTELVAPFALSQPTISKHLKVLEKAGLIARTRDAQFRRCHLRAEPLRKARDWLLDYEKFWEGSFDRLDAYVKELQTRERSNARKRSKRR